MGLVNMEQGMFNLFNEVKEKPKTNEPIKHEQKEMPPEYEVRPPRKFDDYLKVFCGNRKTAMYWYLKHNQQP